MNSRYLIDTHVFLWAAISPNKLSRKASKIIASRSSDVILSSASIWEMAIKKGLGKLKLSISLREFVERAGRDLGISHLGISNSHALEVEYLPPHHADPFDRILVSQSMLEKLPIISSDDTFERYGVKLIW